MKTCFPNIATIVGLLTAFLLGASGMNLHAASFSDDDRSSIGNILNEGPPPRLSDRVWAVASDGSGNLNVSPQPPISREF